MTPHAPAGATRAALCSTHRGGLAASLLSFVLLSAFAPGASAAKAYMRYGPAWFAEPERNSITFWGHSTAYIDVQGTGIVTDPLLESKYVFAFHPRQIPTPPREAYDQAKIVILSHAHQDHLNVPSLERFSAGTVILCSSWVAEHLTEFGPRVHVMEPGDRYEFPGGSIVAVAAHHPGGRWSRKARHDGRALGYVIQSDRGTIYYTGDSEYFEGFAEVGRTFRPNLVLVNVNVHLQPREVVFALRDLGNPGTVVPLHFGAYGGSQSGRTGRWRASLAKTLGDRFVDLAIGESIPLPERNAFSGPAASAPTTWGEPTPLPAVSRPAPLKNFLQIEPGLARGGRPSDEGMRWLASQGYRTVVGFRKDADEAKKLRELGIDYVELPIRADLVGSKAPSDEEVERFLALVRDPARRPLYFHCRRGKDRTGAMAAIVRMELEGWPRDRAIAEMKAAGFSGRYRSLARFVRDYDPSDATSVN
jgi:L-ascorbate metabolism protein UlaG (beta-lactamase superfamily)/protein tyrosine phosphatase (PTP) superfamily phosphohydrolase (DUF442 family)